MFNPPLFPHYIVVSNRHLCRRPFLDQVAFLCRQKPKAFLLREKDLSEEAYRSLAKEVLSLCQAHQVNCILHTHWFVAKELGLRSIHMPLPLLRKNQTSLSFFSQVGCSVHSVEEAQEAQRLGATYLTAGHIFATDCKKDLPPRGLGFLEQVCQSVSLPVYAIGGLHLEDAQLTEVMRHGAKGGCIMSEAMQL